MEDDESMDMRSEFPPETFDSTQITTMADNKKEFNNLIAAERNTEVKHLEEELSYVGETFHLINEQLKQQGGILDFADENIEKAIEETNSGKRSLDDAEKYSNNYRKGFWGIVVGTTTVVVVGLGLLSSYLKSQKQTPINNQNFTLEAASDDEAN